MSGASGAPQVRLIGAVPRSVLARLQMSFNTNKTFLLPAALPAVKKLRHLYFDNSPGKLLVVGHADTAGAASYNDKLSLDRAKAVIAYLEDDFQTWLGFYGAGIDAKQRWGKAEDRLMILSMPDFDTKPAGEDALNWYQRTRGLTVDGKAGDETRKALISEYMALDGASLEDQGLAIEATPHGCGENFPLDDSGEQLDDAPDDNKRDPIDRRVELFFFDPDFGVVPAPPGDNSGPGSTQYPSWRDGVSETIELTPDDSAALKVSFVEVADAHFRTNSAVVLPEGENPSGDEDGTAGVQSAGVFGTALRFNADNPNKSLLVAGHTDTTGSESDNQALSEERARCALALLVGGSAARDDFASLCDGRHTVGDYKQILAWLARAFPSLFRACDPGAIDDNAASGVEPVRAFQKAYNDNKVSLGLDPDATEDLDPDGDVGPKTWGGLFDCYEFALQQELGVNAAGLQALRDKLVFADDAHRSLGFGEHFPVEELGVDQFRSQTNRRVEILFFDPGEAPDLEHAANDPETSDLYLPGNYQHVSITPASASGAAIEVNIRVLDADRNPLSGATVNVAQGNFRTTVSSDASGIAQVTVKRQPTLVHVAWTDPSDAARQFSLDFFPAPGGGEEGAFERLHNVGYSELPTTEERVRAFQEDFGRDPTGNFKDIEADLTAWHDGGDKPAISNPSG